MSEVERVIRHPPIEPIYFSCLMYVTSLMYLTWQTSKVHQVKKANLVQQQGDE